MYYRIQDNKRTKETPYRSLSSFNKCVAALVWRLTWLVGHSPITSPMNEPVNSVKVGKAIFANESFASSKKFNTKSNPCSQSNHVHCPGTQIFLVCAQALLASLAIALGTGMVHLVHSNAFLVLIKSEQPPPLAFWKSRIYPTITIIVLLELNLSRTYCRYIQLKFQCVITAESESMLLFCAD